MKIYTTLISKTRRRSTMWDAVHALYRQRLRKIWESLSIFQYCMTYYFGIDRTVFVAMDIWNVPQDYTNRKCEFVIETKDLLEITPPRIYRSIVSWIKEGTWFKAYDTYLCYRMSAQSFQWIPIANAKSRPLLITAYAGYEEIAAPKVQRRLTDSPPAEELNKSRLVIEQFEDTMPYQQMPQKKSQPEGRIGNAATRQRIRKRLVSSGGPSGGGHGGCDWRLK